MANRECYITIGEEEVALDVEYKFWKGDRKAWDHPNDPQVSDAEIEIIEITRKDGKTLQGAKSHEADIADEILEYELEEDGEE